MSVGQKGSNGNGQSRDGVRRRMRAEDRRQQILSAAVNVFARLGARGCALRDIADACGVTEPLLYKYYPSRRDLFLATVDYAASIVYESWGSDADDPIEGICIRARGRDDDDYWHCVDVLIQARAEAIEDPEIAAKIIAGIEARFADIGDLVARGQSEGRIDPEADTELLTWLLASQTFVAGALAKLDVGFPGGPGLVKHTLAAFSGRPPELP